MRKICSRILVGLTGIVLLCIQVIVPVMAAQVDNDMVYPIASNSISAWPQGPDIFSETAVVMDAETGTVLYDKGMNELRYPASITKIMTALLVLEKCGMDDQVIFTEVCLEDQAPDSSNAGMKVGEVLTVEQCLMVLMLKSANDIATQLAVHTAGSVEAFADMMNIRAQELQCMNTHFVNASGMPDENHYTTAYDMALIFKEAIKNEKFREIIATQEYVLEPTNMNEETRSFRSHHEMVFEGSPFYYEGCFGGKTGGSSISKNTLVSGAVRDGRTLIVVSMRTDIMSIWADHQKLFDYGFQNFQQVEVPGGVVTIPINTETDSLKTEEVGENNSLQYYFETVKVGQGIKEESTPTEAPVTLEAEITPEKEKSEENQKESFLDNIKYGIYGLLMLNGLAVFLIVISVIKRKKKKRKDD